MRFLGAVASVGMLATEAERFLSGGRGAKEVAEGRNQSSNGSTCAPLSRDERERSNARDEGHRAPSVHERSVGYGVLLTAHCSLLTAHCILIDLVSRHARWCLKAAHFVNLYPLVANL